MIKSTNEISSRNDISSQQSTHAEKQTPGNKFAGWWYRYLTPPEPPITASLAQRERARRGRTASVIVIILMLALVIMLPAIIIMLHNTLTTVSAFLGLSICLLAISLNRAGAIEVAGILTLALIYMTQLCIVLGYPGGMTPGRLSVLDFTIIPYVVILAFFPVNSLFPLTGLNLVLTWAIVVFTPHNSTIDVLLRTAPYQIFAHVYILQLVLAAALYLWARSTEQAIKRADRAEEIARLEKREKDRQQQELERMHQLDTGIQQILQTHINVANGDLSARAPLSQEHMLWQVAFALNNLIGRIQRLTSTDDGPQVGFPGNNEFYPTKPQKQNVVPQRKQTQAVRAIPPLTPPAKEKHL